MRVIRNIEFDLQRFRSRVVVVSGFILVAFLLLVVRLFYLQVIRYEDLNEQAENNRSGDLAMQAPIGMLMLCNFFLWVIDIKRSHHNPLCLEQAMKLILHLHVSNYDYI